MAYSGTWYHGGQTQHDPVAYNQNYQQPNQYDQHQQYQYGQQHDYQQNNHQQYNQYQQDYQSPPPPYQTSNYNQNQYHDNHNSQWNQQQQPYHYDERSTSYAQQHQQHQQQHQQQQWIPAHAPQAPPTTVQSYGHHGQRFQYSDLHGTKKALLIGVNYFGSKNELRGCINDVKNIQEFLLNRYHFPAQNMWIMTDDLTDPRSIPTRANILAGMQWLVAGAKPGDNLFLQFSGHGGPIKDTDGDEDDGFDEAIYPVDFETNKNGPPHIVDDLIHDICVKPLPQGCRLTAIFDCCHSGSIMDIPYMYSTKGVLKEPSFIKDTGMGLLAMGQSYGQQDLGSVLAGGAGLLKKAYKHANGHHKKVRKAKSSPADVICFSGCKDVQTSADASISGIRQGAMSHAFKTSLLKYNGQLTYIQLLNAMRDVVAEGGYQQKPQLTACHPLDLDLTFTL